MLIVSTLWYVYLQQLCLPLGSALGVGTRIVSAESLMVTVPIVVDLVISAKSSELESPRRSTMSISTSLRMVSPIFKGTAAIVTRQIACG